MMQSHSVDAPRCAGLLASLALICATAACGDDGPPIPDAATPDAAVADAMPTRTDHDQVGADAFRDIEDRVDVRPGQLDVLEGSHRAT